MILDARILRTTLAAGLLSAVAATASGQSTYLYFNSQPGDYIGQGQQFTFTPADGTITTSRQNGGVRVRFNGSTFWDLYFVAPNSATLVPGVYEDALRWPFQGPKRPGLSVSGASRGCNVLTGRFVVLEATYGIGGAVQSFAADYEQHCEGDPPALFGSVRINSSVSQESRLSVNSVAFYEGDAGTSNATFTVSLSAPSAVTVSVAYGTTDGTATAGSDYQAVAGTLTFAPGVTARTVNVPIVGDTAAEGDEFFVMSLTSPTNATLGFGQGTGNIVDDEGPRTFLYFNSQPGDYIGQGQQFTLTPLDGIITTTRQDGGVHVHFNGSSLWDLYFVAPDRGTLVPGMYEGALRWPFQGTAPGLDVSGDSRGCNTLTGRFVVLEATYDAGGAVQSFAADYEQHCEGDPPALFGSVRINSTVSQAPRLSVNDVAVFEGNVGTGQAVFTVSLSTPSAGTVTLTYATADGTATAGSDYQAVSGTLTFPPGVTSRTVSVPIVGDMAAEGDESFLMNLTTSAGATIAFGTGTGTILDDESVPTFLDFDSQPGDFIGQGQKFTFTPHDGAITVSRQDGGVHVHFAGSASWDLFFVAPNGATLVPGTYEGALRWPFQGTAPGLSVFGGGRGCNTLTGRFVVFEASYDAGGAVQGFAADYEQHCEGGPAALFGRVRVNSSAASTADLAVTISDGFATYAPGASLTYTLTVSNAGPNGVAGAAVVDALPSALSCFTSCTGTGGAVCTAGPFAGSINDAVDIPSGKSVTYKSVCMVSASATGPLTNTAAVGVPFGMNDSNPGNNSATDTDTLTTTTLAINDVTVREGNSGTRIASFTVTLSPAAAEPVSVSYSTHSVTAFAGSDYGPSTGILTFLPGETTKPVDVQVFGDTINERPETFTVVLGPPANALLSDGTGVARIIDDEDKIIEYDGDGRSDLTVFRAAGSIWYRRNSTNGAVTTTAYGGPGYLPVPGDYDGDGITDLAVYYEPAGLWYIRSSSTGTDTVIGFGGPGYQPVRGDFDGDGKSDLAVFHDATGLWSIKSSATGAVATIGFGATGYVPVPGDYDGDGITDLGVYHPPTGLWYTRASSTLLTTTTGFGGSEYQPVRGDFDGDGKTDLAVYHEPSGLWFIKGSSDGALVTMGYGGTGYTPVPGRYDADGKTDVAVYHEASGLWFLRSSGSPTSTSVGFGGPGYTPVH